MRRKYQRPTLSVHCVMTSGMIASSPSFPSEDIRTEDGSVPVSDDVIDPGGALSPRSRWGDEM